MKPAIARCPRGTGKSLHLNFLGMLLIASLGVFAPGCGKRSDGAKEITSLQRKEAENLVTEADFAVSIRDLARAEGLLTKAVALARDTGDFWVNLGSVRMRLGNREGAKSAYESALGAYKQAAKAENAGGSPMLQEVYVLALLGKVDAARKLLDEAQKKFPADPGVRVFVQEKHLDQLLSDPKFKQISL